MCGITGFVHTERERKADTDALRRMMNTLIHRGPDAEGMFVRENVALGHRRLSIIDLQTGDQPQFADDMSITIVYNGEIYNYIELREELKSLGHAFKTDSDTEVIIHAYLQWGTDCQLRFNGMWAFALWDEKTRTLFCSRDRMGEKPLFYSMHDNTFFFGSEMKALFAGGVPKRFNSEMLDAYLCFTYVPAPYTMFRDVFKLPAGHFLLCSQGNIRVAQYWDVPLLDDDSLRKDEDRVVEEFSALFQDSVRLRMRSDVPFGAFLSGGLDSSSIVATMATIDTEPPTTFTIGFDNVEFDERDLARRVADKYKTNHYERIVHWEDALSLMEKLAYHYDEPFGDSSALPTYIVSKIARERVKVVLTGDGGDEVLSGYTVHQGEKFSQQFSHLPVFARGSVIPGGLSMLHSFGSVAWKRKVERMSRVVNAANLDFVDRLESKQNGFRCLERQALLVRPRTRPARSFIEDALRPVQGYSNQTKLNYWLLKVSLADDMLTKVDRASMANSLETRVPFLDHRIVELLAQVSMDVKLKGYTRKHILRKALGHSLPAQVLSARKRGFVMPLRDWLTGDCKDSLEALATSGPASEILNARVIKTHFADHHAGKRDAANALWTLGMLSIALRGAEV